MELELLQKKYDSLFEKIRRVRRWQREYAKYHVERDKQLMVLNERELDDMIHIEEVETKAKQKQVV